MLNLEIIKKELIYKEEECGRFRSGYLLIDFMYSSLGRDVIKNFISIGHERVGIYGAGVLGRCFFDCIKTANENYYKKISVTVMDQNGKSDYFKDQKIYMPDEKPMMSIIVVTLPSGTFEIICNNLTKLGYKNIVSLEEVLYSQSKRGLNK